MAGSTNNAQALAGQTVRGGAMEPRREVALLEVKVRGVVQLTAPVPVQASERVNGKG